MGIKPLKLYQTQRELTGSRTEANRIMAEQYLLAPDKIALLDAALGTQTEEMAPAGPGEVALYVGIPFCPSRCAYCSFTMEEAAAPAGSVLTDYMKALRLEMGFAADKMAEAGLKAESIYVGGGTPTVLDEQTLSALLGFLRTRIPGGAARYGHRRKMQSPDGVEDRPGLCQSPVHEHGHAAKDRAASRCGSGERRLATGADGRDSRRQHGRNRRPSR